MALASAVEWTATVGNAELAAGTEHAKGDLPPVGDENLVEHALDDHERLVILDRLGIGDDESP